MLGAKPPADQPAPITQMESGQLGVEPGGITGAKRLDDSLEGRFIVGERRDGLGGLSQLEESFILRTRIFHGHTSWLLPAPSRHASRAAGVEAGGRCYPASLVS